ncbi:MAG: hydantoinase/oxoprolinase family protein [Candidatus Wallacebacter cryptica]|nr:hydantoinase/oxoprolinase family protein [Bacillota bacterium]
MCVIGIDVGGTNTDAALISEDNRVHALVKTATDHDNILGSTKTALEQILTYNQGNQPVQLHLSTTLSTNAIVEGRGESAAVLALPGPGINLGDFGFDFPIFTIQGYIDHRGRQVADIDREEVLRIADQAADNGAKSLAVVGKFSHRNNSLEIKVKEIIESEGLRFNQITLGHQLSGRLNFPRRIMSAYLNASVAALQIGFVEVIEELMRVNPIIADVRILKADGGTMSLAESCRRPIETILSGPAASIMAAQALSSYTDENIVVIDIGGTTTDIAVIVGGEPLYQRSGAEIGGYQTLVPALLTYSIGLGGDSEVHIQGRTIRLGPRRAGRAVCLGGSQLTPTDAAAALELADIGDRQKAVQVLEKAAEGKFSSWKILAEAILEAFAEQLSQAVNDIYSSLENVPVYTVSEILAPPDIRPRAVVGLGAPAEVFIPLGAQKLGLPWEILPHHAGANGIGAAAARPTIAVTLHADTEQEVMIIPELGYQERIRRNILFDLKKARRTAVEQTALYAQQLGLKDYGDIHIVEEEAFNVVRGFHTVGKIFNIRAQIRPGVERLR